jgi:hypothetical protein
MEHNKSLSARIRRRNAQGFVGVGTGLGFLVKNPGDYTDPEQNSKAADYAREQKRKNKLGFRRIAKGFSLHKRALTKKFADNHQKMS